MEIRTVRRPGEKGTRQLMRQFGERLVCVRYRYDPARHKRFKTVELIVGEEDWRMPPPHPDECRQRQPAPKNISLRRAGVRVGYHETGLRQQVKAAGGVWNATERLWYLAEVEIMRLGLDSRVPRPQVATGSTPNDARSGKFLHTGTKAEGTGY